MDFNKTILLVEDEIIIAMDEALTLGKYGFTVLQAGSGEEAVRMAGEHPEIDLVLMDIDLGTGMDGTEAAQMILGKHDIPVVFLTSHIEPEMADRTDKITSYGYVVKNSGETVLIASLKMAFRLYDSHRALKISENRFKQVFETLPIGLWLADEKGTLLMGNSAGQDIWAAHPQVGQEEYGIFKAWRLPSREPVQPDDWALGHAVNEGRATAGELLEIEAFDGTQKFILNWAAPVRNAEGGISGAFVINQDITERIRTSEQLRISAEQFRGIFDNSSNGIALFSVDNERFIQVNKAFMDMLEYTREELTVMTISDITHPDDRVTGRMQLQQLYAGEVPRIETIQRLITGTGTTVWVERTAGLIRNSGGKHIYGFSVVKDITEHIRTEEELRKSSELIYDLYNNAPCGYHSLNREGVFIQMNDTELNWLGYTREELIGRKKFADVLTPGSMALFNRLFPEYIERGSVYEIEYEFVRRDGSVFPVILNSTAIYGSDGGFIMGRATVFDITERKSIETALDQISKKNEEAIRAARMAYWEYDMAARRFIFNDRFYSLLGITAAQAGGYEMSAAEFAEKYVDPAFAHQVTETIRQAVKSDDPEFSLQIEGRLKRADGEYFWVNTWFRTGKDPSGRTVRLYGVNQDIDSRKQAETSLARMVEEKEVLLRELQHRVKNSLAIIIGLVGLEAQRITDDKARESLEHIRNRVRSLAGLYDLLFRTGEVNEVRLDQYLGAMAASLMNTFASRDRNIILETDLDEMRIDVRRAIPAGLILNELLTNAMKYAFPENREGRILVRLKRTDEGALMEVRDNGKGLPGGFNMEHSKGLGLELIRMLSRQLGADMKWSHENETCFSIHIRI